MNFTKLLSKIKIILTGSFNEIKIIEIIKLFYKRMVQLNIEKACFDQSKHAFSICYFIKVYRVNLIKLYFNATLLTVNSPLKQ